MSHPPLENSPRPSPPNPHFTRIHYALIAAGLLLTAIAGVIRWQLLRFIDQDLAPLVATELSKTLNRPVHVGDVQAYSLSHVRFGPTAIPACTSKQTGCSKPDTDSVTIKALDIRFNVFPILWSRQLPLEATLIQPQIHLDQTQDGEWIATRLHSDASDNSGLKVKLNRVRWQQGTAHLTPLEIEPRQLSQLNGTLNLANTETLYFNSQSQLDSGGKLSLKGEWQPSTKTLDINAHTENLVAAPLIGLLPNFPFQIKQGQLNGHVRVYAQPQTPTTIHTDMALNQGKVWIPDQAIWLQAPKIQVGIQLQTQPHQPAQIKGKAALEGARVDVPEDLILNTKRQQPCRLSEVQGTVNFLGTQQRFKFDLKGKMGQGSRLQARGMASFLEKKANLRLQLQDLPASLFDRAYQIPMTVDSGRLSASLRVKLRPQIPADIQGTTLLKNVTMGIVNVPQPFRRVRGYLRFQGVAVRLEGLKGDYGKIPMQATGWIDPDRGYSLVGQTDWVAAQPLLSTLQVTELPFPVTGQVKGENLRFEGAIDQPIFSGSVKTAGQPRLDRVPFNQLTAKFRLADALLQMTDIQAKPIGGGLFRGQARFNVQPGGELKIGLQAVDLPGNQLANFYNTEPGFDLGPLQGQINLLGPPEDIRTTVNFQALKGDFPTTGTLSIRQNIAQLKNIVTQIPGGKLRTQGQIKDNRVGLTTTIPGVALPAYSTDARGVMTGRLRIDAPFDTFGIETARAQGQLKFSDGIAIIHDPIAAQIRWDGRQILVDQATAPGFQSQGRVGLAVDTPQGPQLTTLNLAVRAQSYDLGLLPAFGPTQIKLAGRANLTGQLTGTIADPFLTSTLQMRNLSMGDVLFEPILTGQMRYGQKARLDLQVSGQRDRIHVTLNSDQLPTAFDIRRDQAWARGKTKQGQLALAFQDIPLTVLNWQPIKTLGPVSGWSSGEFMLNSQTYAGTGRLTVIRPGIGQFMGDRFSGKLQLAPHAMTLEHGTLRNRENTYKMQAQVLPGVNPKFSGTLQIQQAEINDILAVANTLTSAPPTPQLQPQGKATDLPTAPVGNAQGSLLMQLRRLAELDTLNNQQQIPNLSDPILPDWTKVSGLFAGQLKFSGSQKKGLDATFALQSQPLKWGNYKIDQVIAKGQLIDGNLSLRPLQVTSGDLDARFQGTLGNNQQSGQLTLKNLPLPGLTQLLDLPFDVNGMINGQATLAGSLANPRLQGEVTWTDATLNTLSLTQAQTKFAYDQGRLTFQGGSNAIPLQFSGTIPYQLPLTTVGPKNDELQVSLKIKDQGLALFNLLTDQLNWVEGQGAVDLKVAGTLAQPSMEGKIQFNQATLASELLLEPLTHVTGSIQFDQDYLQVNRLTGRYSQGQLQATGSLPIFTSETRRSRSSLQVALKALQLNAKGLYKGQIDGDLNISGAVLEPQLGGIMALTNGQVILADVNGNTAPSFPGQLGQAPPLQFKNLQVQLKDNVRVTQPPLISFLAAGKVLVNGSVNTPRPDGRIHFRKGSVNLFTSRFRIDSRRDNFADFDPSLGLDPYLSIGMVTTATDIVGGRATELNEFEDLPAGRVGAIESIRVRATVEGRASELIDDFNQVINLSSTPNRSEREILALLGGSLPNSLENGNTELALANLASSAFLTGFEGLFSDALGTRANFRLFPVLIPNDSQNTSVLAFGAELGYDITDRFSVSALQILTGLDEATLLNASYDINEQLRIRSAISTGGEAVGILEYRIRF